MTLGEKQYIAATARKLIRELQFCDDDDDDDDFVDLVLECVNDCDLIPLEVERL